MRPNPLAQRMDAVEGQLRSLEDQLGLTPAARLRLGISLVELERDAHRNRWEAVEPPTPDPRHLLREATTITVEAPS